MKTKGKVKGIEEITFDMITNENTWPNWPLLPVKNTRERDGGMPLLGVVCAGLRTQVKLTNMFEFSADAEVRHYESVNKLLEAGWIVD